MVDTRISVIISTYNWPDSLKTVLKALNQNNDKQFEVIVADDGSKEETKACIDALRSSMDYPLHHVWQEDQGFRVAKIRNQAVLKASGDYLIFIDHDCVPRIDFIKQHRRLIEPGFFVSGSRIFMGDVLTKHIIKTGLDITRFSFGWFLRARLQKKCNRCLPMLRLPVPDWLRKIRAHKWQGTKNLLGIWRKDMMAVNGYDEAFIGWGYEDSDLVCRLLSHGVKRKEGKFATEVIHLHHKILPRDRADSNYDLLQDTISGKRQVFAKEGIVSRAHLTS